MSVDPKQADSYVRQALQQLQGDVNSLTEQERRLLRKYQKYDQMARQAGQDAEQLRSQIQQAEARLRSIELQIVDAQGKAAGFIEYLISAKFEDEASADPDISRQSFLPLIGDEIKSKKTKALSKKDSD